ncbi:protein FAM156A/FAM156B [Sorex araneus]|uniref:protein FAM156A/FAM156B n=1 Tax=Sorex araneus TaxID=42254 RepID=UPI00033185E3|nr:protein FAM156A/FAM156B [Sorex araneus]XP_054976429.1 protein FAM156A/FAM156B [Sorex araneus]XP_054976430.1 protein FAM156A/FAM156B [Sorex araneus]XP_054976431.1 protein FAM156A/FAM156B [Sorex araneus]XP_054976432.1 protein FAM156A/FAM156B [Sorex araneus]XP_054976433.1 protein FAM156A/FAM156B [Sorex araneus]
MDPHQKHSPSLVSEPSTMTCEETSQEVPPTPQVSFSEMLMMGLSDLNLSPDANSPAALPERLLQQRYRDEKSLQERWWERPVSPRRKMTKMTFLGHPRQRNMDLVAPYRVKREARVFSSSHGDQNTFRCECRYCQTHKPSALVLPAERSRAPPASSWDTLVQGLNGLTLSLGTSGTSLVQEAARQQQDTEEKLQVDMEQESKEMFQRLLKQWLKEN